MSTQSNTEFFPTYSEAYYKATEGLNQYHTTNDYIYMMLSTAIDVAKGIVVDCEFEKDATEKLLHQEKITTEEASLLEQQIDKITESTTSLINKITEAKQQYLHNHEVYEMFVKAMLQCKKNEPKGSVIAGAYRDLTTS